jgi:hypothetical protein
MFGGSLMVKMPTLNWLDRPPEKIHYVHDLWGMILPNMGPLTIIWKCPFIKGLKEAELDFTLTPLAMPPMKGESYAFGLEMEIKAKNLKFVLAFPFVEHRKNLMFLLHCHHLMILAAKPCSPFDFDEYMAGITEAMNINPQDFHIKDWEALIHLIERWSAMPPPPSEITLSKN